MPKFSYSIASDAAPIDVGFAHYYNSRKEAENAAFSDLMQCTADNPNCEATIHITTHDGEKNEVLINDLVLFEVRKHSGRSEH